MFTLSFFGKTCPVLRIGTEHWTSSPQGLPCTSRQGLTKPTWRNPAIWKTVPPSGKPGTHTTQYVLHTEGPGLVARWGHCSHGKSQVPISAQPWFSHLSRLLFSPLGPYRTLVQVTEAFWVPCHHLELPSTPAWQGRHPPQHIALNHTVWMETTGMPLSAALGLRGPDAGTVARAT